jgi:hypothetical protein
MGSPLIGFQKADREKIAICLSSPTGARFTEVFGRERLDKDTGLDCFYNISIGTISHNSSLLFEPLFRDPEAML